MKFPRLTRRRFLWTMAVAFPGAIVADARWVEPSWVKVRRLRLGDGPVRHRFVHFTDLHYKGDRDALLALVRQINELSPEFVCFTGDLIEEQEYLSEALELLAAIRSPLYGVPGNHDDWSHAPSQMFVDGFARTGGAWLQDEGRDLAGGAVQLIGASCRSHRMPLLPPSPGKINILMMHYPAWVKKIGELRYDLILAGHSHGGQVRVPFWGAVMLPYGVDEFDLGLFETRCGPLYVNPGIGWFPVPLRFNCRPELTLFEI